MAAWMALLVGLWSIAGSPNRKPGTDRKWWTCARKTATSTRSSGWTTSTKRPDRFCLPLGFPWISCPSVSAWRFYSWSLVIQVLSHILRQLKAFCANRFKLKGIRRRTTSRSLGPKFPKIPSLRQPCTVVIQSSRQQEAVSLSSRERKWCLWAEQSFLVF